MSVKGSWQRKLNIPYSQWEKNFERIFHGSNERSTTPDAPDASEAVLSEVRQSNASEEA